VGKATLILEVIPKSSAVLSLLRLLVAAQFCTIINVSSVDWTKSPVTGKVQMTSHNVWNVI
jgi:hypothetical protein